MTAELPRFARPESVEELSEIMSAAHRDGHSVAVYGGGTALDDHPPGQTPGLFIDMSGLNRVIEHSPGDLILVAEAGAPIAALKDVADTGAQELLSDFPADRVDSGSTLGGAIATRAVGPRRIGRLPLREVVLGVTVVLADGTIAKAGGKVVKNVAGYDMSKLMTGSWGTLGIIASAAIRLYPKPETQGYVEIPGAEAALRVLGSQIAPAAVEIDRSPGAEATTVVMVEGLAESVESRTRQIIEAYPGAKAGIEPSWWARRAQAPVTIRASVSPALVPELVAQIARLEDAIGYPIQLRGSAMGVFDLGVGAPDMDPAIATRVVLEHLRTWDRKQLVATLLCAPPAVWNEIDAWGEIPGFALMATIKDQFDPNGLLSPGRGIGGL
ncbi:FAD-binding oxidoreductase [Brevibacterium sp. UCMA 11752]|uniref:FAD-binding oxidoreductase n=1 Tax=Brevibacterium sp. UCMA 11752 TaxID=2745946 RepID=UPI001F23E3F6|nr:FAD-binding oxidoreductase [Brevibacterium sp. UCMA 11752]MCF2587696.1 FAD-binding oxidoreductase [Brevibacterium sp. UCMA 11752]